MSMSSTQTMHPADKLYIIDLAWPMFSQKDNPLTCLTWLHGNGLELPAKCRSLSSKTISSARLLARMLNRNRNGTCTPSDNQRNSRGMQSSILPSRSRALPLMTSGATPPRPTENSRRNLNWRLLNKQSSIHSRLFHVICCFSKHIWTPVDAR